MVFRRDEQTLWRTQTSMVLLELERTLGRYVASRAHGSIEALDDVLRRLATRDHDAAGSDTSLGRDRAIIGSYLADVVKAAVEVSAGSEREHLRRLATLIDVLQVFDVRNAVAHPNNPFPVVYWYRTLAIAADPLMQMLQFDAVTQQSAAAISGSLIEIPQAWLEALAWVLPNNVPRIVEHELTGLIGRSKELRQLRLFLEKNRRVAVVARGGVGKTALVIEVLRALSGDTGTTHFLDRIIWYSAKTHDLTVTGIVQRVDVAPTVQDIWSVIANTMGETDFEGIVSHHSSERVLLVIDNLETILAGDAARDSFLEFSDSLPEEWRVVVTSRITIDGYRTLGLSAFDTPSAREFANAYSRAVRADIVQEAVAEIAQYAGGNPLSIRLMVDAVRAGWALDTAIARTTEDVIDFSYQNLVELLRPESRQLLEAMFVMNRPVTRVELIEVTRLDDDTAAGALAELRTTSLISLSLGVEDERFDLATGVRDLLLRRPADLESRQSVLALVSSRATKRVESRRLQHAQKTADIDRYHIPDGSSDAIYEMARKAIRLLSAPKFDRASAAALCKAFEKKQQQEAANGVLLRFHGLLRIELNDTGHAIELLRRAADSPIEDPASAFVLCRIVRESEPKLAFEYATRLWERGYDDPARSSEDFARNLAKNRWLAAIWSGKDDIVLAETSSVENPILRALAIRVRALALRHRVEHIWRKDPRRGFASLEEASNILLVGVTEEGWTPGMISEAAKLVAELGYSAGQAAIKPELEQQRTFGRFVRDACESLLARHRDWSQSSERAQFSVGNILRFWDGARSALCEGSLLEKLFGSGLACRVTSTGNLFSFAEVVPTGETVVIKPEAMRVPEEYDELARDVMLRAFCVSGHSDRLLAQLAWIDVGG